MFVIYTMNCYNNKLYFINKLQTSTIRKVNHYNKKATKLLLNYRILSKNNYLTLRIVVLSNNFDLLDNYNNMCNMHVYFQKFEINSERSIHVSTQ